MAIFSVDIANTYVAAGGDIIVVAFKDASGDPIAPTTVTLEPSTAAHTASITVNGGGSVTLSRQICLGNTLFLRVQDSGASITGGETVNLTFPSAVCSDGTTNNTALSSTTIGNKANQDAATTSLTGYGETMQMGVNIVWKNYWSASLFCNNMIKQGNKAWSYAAGGGTYVTVDSSTGLPTATDATYVSCILHNGRPFYPIGTYRVRWKSSSGSATAYVVGTSVTGEVATSEETPGTDGDWYYRDFTVANDDYQVDVRVKVPITAIEVLYPGVSNADTIVRANCKEWWGEMPLRFLSPAYISEMGETYDQAYNWTDMRPREYFSWGPAGAVVIDIISASGEWSSQSSSNPGCFHEAGFDSLQYGLTTLEVLEITTNDPHGLRDGDLVYFTSHSAIKYVLVTGTYTFKIASSTTQTRSGDIKRSIKGAMGPESQVDVANELNSDIWQCVPAHASDTFIEDMCDMLLADLSGSKKVYIELSNEVWNNGLYGYWHNRFMNEATSYGTWFSQRSAEIHKICRDKFATAGKSNLLICVLASQTANSTVTANVLNRYYIKANAEGYSNKHPDVIAVAPYLGDSFYVPTSAATAAGEDARDFYLWSSDDVKLLDVGAMNTLILLDYDYKINPWMSDTKDEIDDHNTTYSSNVGYCAYEGGTIGCWFTNAYINGKSSTGSANYTTAQGEELRLKFTQISRHPYWRGVVLEHYRAAEDYGMSAYFAFCECKKTESNNSSSFGIQNWYDQQPGRGDGSNGGYDNTTDLTDSNVKNLESVQMQAMKDWIAAPIRHTRGRLRVRARVA